MRIRKNSKRVLVDGQSSSLLICQLNRSPWDIDSLFTQGECPEWDNDLPLNTSISPASDSIESMELSFEYVGNTPSQSEREKDSSIEEIGSSNIHPPPQIFPTAPLRPKKVARPPIPASILPKKRGRPRKSTTGAVGATNNNNKRNNSDNNNSENPYELYYYSGFGPSWSKQRGGSKSAPENGNDMETLGSSLTTRESSMSDYDDDENKNNKDGNDNGVMIQSFDSVLAAERELDYIGDEDEGDEDDLYTGKPARKPIKARSLKSLM